MAGAGQDRRTPWASTSWYSQSRWEGPLTQLTTFPVLSSLDIYILHIQCSHQALVYALLGIRCSSCCPLQCFNIQSVMTSIISKVNLQLPLERSWIIIQLLDFKTIVGSPYHFLYCRHPWFYPELCLSLKAGNFQFSVDGGWWCTQAQAPQNTLVLLSTLEVVGIDLVRSGSRK